MGNDNNVKEKQGDVTPRRESLFNEADQQRKGLWSGPTNTEAEYTPISQNFYNAYKSSSDRQVADYGNIMQNYSDWQNGTVAPLAASINNRVAPTFTSQQITTPRTSGESLAGYKNFADTGGYSDADVRDIRARGMSPITAAYGNTMRELDRSRSLAGGGGAANYIAARSRAQRELPQQLADAEQGVNAQLAESIRSGKLAGLAGMTGITEGEAGRALAAAQSNQQADLRAQELTEQGMSAKEARQMALAELSLKGTEGKAQLFGTSPGMTSTTGNQALSAYQNRINLDQLRNQYGLGLIDSQLQTLGQQAPPGKPWWQTGLEVGGQIAGAFAGA